MKTAENYGSASATKRCAAPHLTKPGSTMISFDEALRILEARVTPVGRENLPLRAVDGRVLAEDLTAGMDFPRSDVYAMDGYAVCRNDMLEPGERFKVVGEAYPGTPFAETVGPGQAVRIFTGAAMPPGAERVVVQEDVARTGAWILLERKPGAASHVRCHGSDFKEGSILLAAGQFLGPRDMIAAAAAETATVTVAQLPRVVIISTGDELVEPGTTHHRPGTIPDTVSFGIAACVRQWGGRVMRTVRVVDRLEKLQAAAGEAFADGDLIVVTGGASVGERDFGKPMFAPHGLQLLFANVAIKPGKPVWLGHAADSHILGLPGNPVSAMVVARLFLRPLLALMLGQRRPAALEWRRLPLAVRLNQAGDREAFVRAAWREDGLYPLENQDTGAQSALADAGWLIRCSPRQRELAKGEIVSALAFE